jgi:hypothetical protein
MRDSVKFKFCPRLFKLKLYKYDIYLLGCIKLTILLYNFYDKCSNMKSSIFIFYLAIINDILLAYIILRILNKISQNLSYLIGIFYLVGD